MDNFYYKLIANLEYDFMSSKSAMMAYINNHYGMMVQESAKYHDYIANPIPSGHFKAYTNMQSAVTALGCSRILRRCCANNDDSFDYENYNEVYPVIMLIYKNPQKIDTSIPSRSIYTEVYIGNNEKPFSIQLLWMNRNSITFSPTQYMVCNKLVLLCTDVKFVEPDANSVHPFITPYKGSILGTSLRREVNERLYEKYKNYITYSEPYLYGGIIQYEVFLHYEGMKFPIGLVMSSDSWYSSENYGQLIMNAVDN